MKKNFMLKVTLPIAMSFAAAVFSLAVFSAGCSRKNVLADLGAGEKITLEDYQKRLKNTPQAYARYLDSPQGRKQFLDLMVREKLVLAESKKSGISSSKEYKETLSRYDADAKKRREEFKESLAMELFLRKLHTDTLNPSEQEIKNYYEMNRGDYEHPVEMGISHILVLDEKTADEVLARLKKGESFEKLASLYSVDPTSSERGGQLGIVKKGDLTPELESVARKLKVGGISNVIKTDYGYHILKKTSERGLEPIRFEAASEEIRRTLIKNRLDEWVKDTLKKKNIRVDYSLASQAAITHDDKEAASSSNPPLNEGK